MRYLLINSVCGTGSTGRICVETAQKLMEQGYEVKIAYGRKDNADKRCDPYAVRIGTKSELLAHVLQTRLLDSHGLGSKKATKRFLQWAESYDPDVLWLHNLHGYYIHIGLLFEWIKSRPRMQVRWTLHDCWAFTGHCCHFSFAGCNKWTTRCEACKQKGEYPASLLMNNAGRNFDIKKQLFCNVPNMKLLVPSEWLANLVRKSFLKDYEIEVCPNTVNKEIFKPTENNVKKKLGIEGKRMILGVASLWNEKKGYDDFIKLSCMLDDSFAVVLVGLTEEQLSRAPQTLIGLPRTESQRELAQIYTAADVYVNTSKEETFGLTTLEALSCGTPVMVYEGTACEEVTKANGGMVVPNRIESLYEAVKNCVWERK